jgi:CheY-like chemotaxis protein
MPAPEPILQKGQLADVRSLLIGGEPAEAYAVQSVLEAEGYELCHRFLAAEAIAILSAWEPSLVMLCLQVSDMTASTCAVRSGNTIPAPYWQ